MYQVRLNEAKTRLADLIETAFKGEEVFILKDDRQIVQLVPTELPKRHPQFGSARGLIVLAEDFDAPLAAGELVKRCRLFCGGNFRPHPRVTRIIGNVR